jgi:aminoglycoside phosphotransferase (APT) family kinase protein
MSMAQYLWAVARGLQTQVYPHTSTGASRDALKNSIHILTVIANALEPAGAGAVPRPARLAAGSEWADTDRLGGPAENTAAYRDTAAAIAAAASHLDADAKPGVYRGSDVRAVIRWEKALIDSAIARMDSVATAAPDADPDAPLEIDPLRLQSFLRRHLSLDRLEVADFRQVLGGRSRQTALFTVRGAPGVSELVVQRLLPGLKVGAAFASMATQYQVLERLHAAGLKVPKPFCFDSGEEALGSPFLVTERSRGESVQPDYWSPPESKRVVLELAEQMARLHAQPIGDLDGVVSRARTRSDKAGWIAELDRLAADWHRLAHWPSVTVSAALAWLRSNIDCVEDRETLVHNDMVFHNILAVGDRLTAVLDWEQISIGNPAEDLGYCYPAVAARLDWQEFLDAYHAAGGPNISVRQVDYFALRAVLRLMILVLQGGRDAFEQGHAQDVLVASAGAFFSQHLLHRFAQVLDAVLERDGRRAAQPSL